MYRGACILWYEAGYVHGLSKSDHKGACMYFVQVNCQYTDSVNKIPLSCDKLIDVIYIAIHVYNTYCDNW